MTNKANKASTLIEARKEVEEEVRSYSCIDLELDVKKKNTTIKDSLTVSDSPAIVLSSSEEQKAEKSGKSHFYTKLVRTRSNQREVLVSNFLLPGAQAASTSPCFPRELRSAGERQAALNVKYPDFAGVAEEQEISCRPGDYKTSGSSYSSSSDRGSFGGRPDSAQACRRRGLCRKNISEQEVDQQEEQVSFSGSETTCSKAQREEELLSTATTPTTMVYFICQGCQETLKKPAVKKHLQTRCWGASMTCVDCFVCFTGDSWEKHTSCISEEKKFHGALYCEKADKLPKGQQKQEGWTANLQKALEFSRGGRVEKWMEKIVTYDNVPRKRPGFANFVKNSCRIQDDKLISEMWALIEKANAKEPKSADGTTTSKDGATTGSAGGASISKKRGRWLGWEKEIDLTLLENGGAMAWSDLAEQLAQRYEEQSAQGVVKKRKRCVLADLVLSNVPEKYLSTECTEVRKC
ncbi:unnamed protein product [Amoebophrya sp. A120]|nr:unnamed protein product [Amoebophrya sp. A120]|eukprot:GSA120T00019986001.1